MIRFNGMVQNERDIQSRCNVCREELGRVVLHPSERICDECQQTIDKSLARFLARADVQAAILGQKERTK